MRSEGKIKLLNMDCLDFMKQCENNAFDLAIVDPPYGIDADQKRGDTGRNGHIKQRDYHIGNWDKGIPTDEYFEQLFRVSKNQIIWGGNYFDLPPTQCFIFWYKQNPVPNFADGELAWTSFKKPAVCIDYRYYGNLQGKTSVTDEKIHPTQKPIDLYRNTLKLFAEQGMKILDTHGGSMTIAIACDKMGFDLDICEKDTEYFNKAIEKYNKYKSQTTLF